MYPAPAIVTPSSSKSAYEATRESLRDKPRVWLVTGAAGFIGSNLVQELLALGQRVVGLDNFSTGHQSNVDEVMSADPDAAERFRFVEGDIRDASACAAACDGVDYVLHQAALASVPRSIKDPVSSTQVNVDGSLNVLIAARDAGATRVVYASSSSVYGDARTVPQVEHSTGRVLSPYAATKATNETFASVFQRTYGLETIGLRYFNVFGRRQDPNGAYAAVIPRWTARLLGGEPCEIFGDGSTSRDFCYIANVVQANVLAATVPSGEATDQVYNVACGDETSLNDLFRMIRDNLSVYAPVVASHEPQYSAERAGDIRRSLADVGKARRLLGYAPAYRVAEGMAETLSWYAARFLPQEYEAHVTR